MSKGKVWLIGAGPSDPGLFTLKGKLVLEQADVVVYDQLVGDGILKMIPKSAEKIDVGKKAGNHKVPQEEINEILLREALNGKKVVRLKGGDPFLFGRGGEELELLCENKIPFEIVPGITSAISVPAYAGIPVTHRDYSPSLHIITAHRKRGSEETVDYKKLVALGDVTLVFLMGVGALNEISQGLIEAGMNKRTPAAILEKGTSSAQRRVVADIETLPKEAEKYNIGTPGIIVVGKVCTLAEKFHWAEDRELGGARIVVTRPKKRSSKLMEKLYNLGAEIIELPAIETVSVQSDTLNEMIQKINNFNWLVFTSAVSVEILFDYLKSIRMDIRNLVNIKWAAVGPATKDAIESRGILVDYIPEEYNGEALAKGLISILNKDDNILVFTPEGAAPPCVKALRQEGFNCDSMAVYKTEYEENEEIKLRVQDIVAFTSASTVKGFVRTMKNIDFKTVTAVCIGEQTAEEARKHEMKVAVSEKASIESLTEKITEIYNIMKHQEKN